MQETKNVLIDKISSKGLLKLNGGKYFVAKSESNEFADSPLINKKPDINNIANNNIKYIFSIKEGLLFLGVLSIFKTEVDRSLSEELKGNNDRRF